MRKLMILPLFLQLILSAIARELKFIQVVSRHGARYPSYPNDYDFSNISTIHNSVSQLTRKGKSMHYLLGKQLYEKYWHQLFKNTKYQSTYDQTLIYAKSTNANRTIESLQAQLQGFLEKLAIIETRKQNQYDFPSFLKNNRSKSLSKEEEEKISSIFTFPIHVEQGSQGDKNVANLDYEGDFLVKIAVNLCPNQHQWEQQNMNSAYVSDIMANKKIKSVIDLIGTLSNRNSITLIDAYQYINNYISLKKMGQKYLTQFDNVLIKKQLDFLHVSRLYISFLYTEQQRKVYSTRLLDKTIQNMKKAVETGPKIVLYLGHDSTIVTLLASMNFASIECIAQAYFQGAKDPNCYTNYPGFASTFIFELWQEAQGHYTIDILINGQKYAIPICNYSEQCPLQQFERWFQSYAIESPNRQCGLKYVEMESNIPFFLVFFFLGLLIPIVYSKVKELRISTPTPTPTPDDNIGVLQFD